MRACSTFPHTLANVADVGGEDCVRPFQLCVCVCYSEGFWWCEEYISPHQRDLGILGCVCMLVSQAALRFVRQWTEKNYTQHTR